MGGVSSVTRAMCRRPWNPARRTPRWLALAAPRGVLFSLAPAARPHHETCVPVTSAAQRSPRRATALGWASRGAPVLVAWPFV
nr:unnamed protein product [Digitaria exilis]